MPQAAFLKSRFDLTPAEARIVLRLVAGDSLQSAAKALGVTYGTVRTHLKRYSTKPERVGKRNWSLWLFAQ